MEDHIFVEGLADKFRANSNQADAQWMKAYMKDRFPFFGVKSLRRRDIVREYLGFVGLPVVQDWQKVCKLFWQVPEREMQYVSMELTFRYKKHWKKSDLSFFEMLIIEKSWWDSVDYIASTIIGHYFKKFPEQIPAVITRWNESNNIWLNRTAIIFQLKYGKTTDFDLMKYVIESHLGSKEFFINKAIGWALRQYARYEPDEVRDYVERTDLSPLSRREALKHL